MSEPVKPHQVMRALEALGFERVRQSSLHAVYRHPDGRWATTLMPESELHLDYHHPDGRWTSADIHEESTLSKGLLKKILKDAGTSLKELREKMK